GHRTVSAFRVCKSDDSNDASALLWQEPNTSFDLEGDDRGKLEYSVTERAHPVGARCWFSTPLRSDPRRGALSISHPFAVSICSRRTGCRHDSGGLLGRNQDRSNQELPTGTHQRHPRSRKRRSSSHRVSHLAVNSDG